MLFVDGMNGVINHNETVQWLYTLTGSLVSPQDTSQQNLPAHGPDLKLKLSLSNLFHFLKIKFSLARLVSESIHTLMAASFQ